MEENIIIQLSCPFPATITKKTRLVIDYTTEDGVLNKPQTAGEYIELPNGLLVLSYTDVYGILIFQPDKTSFSPSSLKYSGQPTTPIEDIPIEEVPVEEIPHK